MRTKNNMLAFGKFIAAVSDAVIACDKTGTHTHENNGSDAAACIRCNIVAYLPPAVAHQIRQARDRNAEALHELTALSYRALAECAGMAAHCSTPDTCLPQDVGDALVEFGYIIKTESRDSGPHWYAITEAGCTALTHYQRAKV